MRPVLVLVIGRRNLEISWRRVEVNRQLHGLWGLAVGVVFRGAR